MCGILCMYNYNRDLSAELPKFKQMLELLKKTEIIHLP